MASNPIFSTKELRIIYISGSILGLFLVGLGIGEHLQTHKNIPENIMTDTHAYNNELFWFVSLGALLIIAMSIMLWIMKTTLDILMENKSNEQE